MEFLLFFLHAPGCIVTWHMQKWPGACRNDVMSTLSSLILFLLHENSFSNFSYFKIQLKNPLSPSLIKLAPSLI